MAHVLLEFEAVSDFLYRNGGNNPFRKVHAHTYGVAEGRTSKLRSLIRANHLKEWDAKPLA